MEKLFVYGRLKSGYEPPEHSGPAETAHIQGQMYVAHDATQPGGTDPHLVDAGHPAHNWIEGEILRVHPRVLRELDGEEHGFARRKVETRNGDHVHVYEWSGRIPQRATYITKWGSK